MNHGWPSSRLRGGHYRNPPLAIWAMVCAVALVSSLLTTLQAFISDPVSAATSVLTQNGCIFENDDGADVDSNTQQAAGNTAITSVKKGERVTVRCQVTNTGSAFNSDLNLTYDKNNGLWSKVSSDTTATLSGTTACTNLEWTCQGIDSDTYVTYNAFAVDSSGIPWVVYRYGWSPGTFRVAHYVGSGGTGCSATSAWTCETIISSDAYGDPTIAFDNTGKPVIALISGWRARQVQYVGSGGTGCAVATWTCTEIDAIPSMAVSYRAAILINGSNRWIIYSAGSSGVKMARYVTSGGSGCSGTSAWTCTTVDTDSTGGVSISAALDGSNNPWIAYKYFNQNNLRVARYVGSGGSGCGVSDWTCTTVRSSVHSLSNTSIAFSPSGTAYVTDHTSAGSLLYVATYVGGSGGTGCTDTAWTCTDIQTPGSERSQITFDPFGTPVISFRGSNTDGLSFATYVGSGGTGCTSTAWTCTSVHSAAQGGTVYYDSQGNLYLLSVPSSVLTFSRYIGSGDITMAPGRAGSNGDAISESHLDMTSTSDTANRDDADCTAGGATWANGKWSNAETLPLSLASNKCTEVAFTIDTSQAVAGTTYRFAVGVKDSWRTGTTTVTNYATLTIASTTTTRVSKDSSPDFANCSESTEWGCQVVDVDGDTGGNASMAVDSSGNTWISYEDWTDSNLHVAQYVGSGGNCDDTGGSDAWNCTTVDATGITGEDTSIAIDPSNVPWVAYYDWTNKNLRVARYVGSGGNCDDTGGSDAWTCTTVDATGEVGRELAIAMDPTGIPWISYTDTTNYNLKVARYVGSGGNCDDTGGSDAWTCTTVDATGDVGNSSTIAFDSSGAAWIAYDDYTNHNLKVARYVGSGGNCDDTGGSDAWTCTTVDAASKWYWFTSIAIDSTGSPWVSYYNYINGDLKVARYVGSGGNCDDTGGSDAWTCTTVEATGSVGLVPSIAFDSAGVAWIAYSRGSTLGIARYVGSGGNCDDTGGSDAWTCASIDTTSGSDKISLLFDKSGIPRIAYDDESSGGDLKVAKLHTPPNPPSYNNLYTNPGPNATQGDARWHLDAIGYDNITSVDGMFDTVSATAAESPTYVASKLAYHNTDSPSFSWTGQSSVAPSSQAINIQIWNASTQQWVTPGSVTNGCSAAAANTNCTITATATTTGSPSTFYATDSTHYWSHWRIYQTYGSAAELRTDQLLLSTYSDEDVFYQRGYIWENDDSTSPDGNTQLAAANTAVTNIAKGNRITLRVQLDNSLTTQQSDLGLFYDRNDDVWAEVTRDKPDTPDGEITASPGRAGVSSTVLSESHVDMTSTSDSANRDDADCINGAMSWVNGNWTSSPRTNIRLENNQCTEVAFVIDTTQALSDTTYRFVVAPKDNYLPDAGTWRWPMSVGTYPTLTIAPDSRMRIAKDASPAMPNCTDAAWGCAIVDTTGNVGGYASVAFDPTGNAWVAFAEGSNLKVARYVGTGGTGCSNTSWTCTTVATGNGHLGLAFDLTGDPWITYRSSTAQMVAHYVGSGGTGCTSSAWTCTTIATTGNYSSIAIDASGNPWISYVGTDGDVYSARYVGNGGTGCVSPAWTCEWVHNPPAGGVFTTRIAISPTGHAWITYEDNGWGYLYAAEHVGSGGTGCDSTAWSCTTIQTSVYVYQGVSIAFDPNGNPWISYEDNPAGHLYVAQYVGSGGSDCASTAWTCTLIDSTYWIDDQTSIAFDANGNAWIAYQRWDSASKEYLKVARHVGSSGTGCASTAWTCTTVDSSSNFYQGVSLAFDTSGIPWVSYRDNTGVDLKIAKLHTSPTSLSGDSLYKTPGRNATQGDARWYLDPVGKSAVSLDDNTYDTVTTTADEMAIYTFAGKSASNTSMPDYEWRGQSTIATSSKNAKIEIYRFGSTNAWVTLATDSSTAADTQFTLRGTASAGSASEYWQSDGSEYWAHYRVIQDSGSALTLSTDYISEHNVAPDAPTSLNQLTVSDATITTGAWHNSTSVKFSASISDPNNPDTLYLCVEVKPIGSPFTNTEDVCSSGFTHSGSPQTATFAHTLTDADEYHWQARVKDFGGLYSSWVSYGGNAESARDIGIDATAPTGGTVYDGTIGGIDSGFNDGSLTTLSANWPGISADVSGLVKYEYSIGISPGGTTIKNWTDNGTTTSVTASGLTLQTGVVYYFNVRTTDGSGNTAIISSNGQMVAPTIVLSLSTNEIVLDNLNLGNSYTASETLDIYVATNAYGGYQVTQYSPSPLTYGSNTIPTYGGTWSTPTAWSGVGFGYTSDDTNVAGSNRFNSGTYYAGIKNGAPGDVVADSPTAAVVGDSYTLTYRLTAAPDQPAGSYSARIVIGVTAGF